jgi:exopolysaccharide biosynthesis polyprenyl glycosylphosphotransferase
MFDRHYHLYSRILFITDVVATLPALFLAYSTRFYLVKLAPTELKQFFHPELLPFRDYLVYLLIFLPAWFLLLAATQRYRDVLKRPLSWQMARLFNFFLLSGGLVGLVAYTLKLEISRPIFFIFFGLMVVFLPLNRILLQLVLRSRNFNEHNQIRILIVGTDERARQVGAVLEKSRKYGYHVVGYVEPDRTSQKSGLKTICSIDELSELIQEEAPADEVIFTGNLKSEWHEYGNILRLCEEVGIRTRIAADLIPGSASTVSLETLGNLPLITFVTTPEQGPSLVIKRIMDFFIASITLIVCSPLMLLVAFFIKFTSPGHVFYRQIRCGLNGRRFALTKFRTMVDGAEDKLWEIRHLNEMDGPVFKMRDDPRVTPLGRFLRKTSIDELPQLWNVIKGEMSIVGPRAPLIEEVRHYSLAQKRRLSVKPGITCLWQVSGRSEISFERWMAMDLEYIDNWSLWLDLQILMRTIPAVFSGRGAH